MKEQYETSKKTINFQRKKYIRLTLLWWRPLSYRNQSIDLLHKSMDWFLYDNSLRHERVKAVSLVAPMIQKTILLISSWATRRAGVAAKDPHNNLVEHGLFLASCLLEKYKNVRYFCVWWRQFFRTPHPPMSNFVTELWCNPPPSHDEVIFKWPA